MTNQVGISWVLGTSCPKEWSVNEALVDPEVPSAFVGVVRAKYMVPDSKLMILRFEVQRNLKGAPFELFLGCTSSFFEDEFVVGKEMLIFGGGTGVCPDVEACLPTRSLSRVENPDALRALGHNPVPLNAVVVLLLLAACVLVFLGIRRARRTVPSKGTVERG